MTPLDPSKIKRILLIKLRAIGDVLLSTAVLPDLRAAFPDARIDFLTSAACHEVLEGNTFIGNMIIFTPGQSVEWEPIVKARKGKYDLVIDLFGNPRSAIITLLSGAPHRVGYRFGWRRFCYTIVAEPRGGSVHNVEFNLDALRSLNLPVFNIQPMFPLRREDEEFAEQFISNDGFGSKPLVALNAGGGWITKRWPPERFAELGDEILRKYSFDLLIIWGPGEEERAATIRDLMKARSALIPRCGLKQLGAILKRCAVLVTNDSGPMHIAATLGTPVLAIFGPTNPMLQGPVGGGHEIVRSESLSCLGCNLTQCPIGLPCMLELQVDAVMAAFDRLVHHHRLFPVKVQS